MGKQNLKGTKSGRLSGKLLGSVMIPDEEIDRVIGEPRLFEAIKAGIRAEEARRVQNQRAREGSNRTVWNLRRTAAAMAAFGAVVLGGFGLSKFAARQFSPTETALENLSEIPLDSARQNPDLGQGSKAVTEPQVAPADKPLLARKARTEVRHSAKTREIAKQEQRVGEEVGEFQSLTYAGDVDTLREAGQIVRVELPRSSLFAMGVDVPVENEKNNKIKADLLIGEDGVMRAVRLVGSN